MKITKVTEDAVATLLDDLLKRSPNNYTGYADKVQAIIDDVRERGDEDCHGDASGQRRQSESGYFGGSQ